MSGDAKETKNNESGRIRLPCGLCPKPVVLDGRADWYPPLSCSPVTTEKDKVLTSAVPNGDTNDSDGLKVYNSLTGRLEAFRPSIGRNVRMYVCGPTVYDSCHMGHARAYLTFDILRRIVEDYFGYDVTYQMNVTDVDDKIVLRARQNKLMADYRAEVLSTSSSEGLESLRSDVSVAMQKMKEKAQKRLDTAIEESKNTTLGGRDSGAATEELAAAKLKWEQFEKTEAHVGQCSSLMAESTSKDDAAEVITEQKTALMEAAHDALASWLDAERGATITDHRIFEDHARRYEAEFWEDMEALGVVVPDVVTRVTEYVCPKIVDYVAVLIQHGYAYPSPSGSVYFDTRAFRRDGYDYRKLVPGDEVSAAAMAEGEGALSSTGPVPEKRHPHDFALWKASRPGEPRWPSPWGDGRPGWHIECSVMASDILGENMDVHGGGVDLMFPHHDNEVAQSEAYHQCAQWVNYFWHAGHLHISGLKMSKSLKNFVTIRQALGEGHTARQLRLMFLLQPWNRPMNYSDQTVGDAKKKESYFKNFLGKVRAELRNRRGGPSTIGAGGGAVHEPQGWNEADRAMHGHLASTRETVHAKLCNNFDTSGAMEALVKLVGECNQYLSSSTGGTDLPKPALVRRVASYVCKMLRIFGVIRTNDSLTMGDEGTSEDGGSSANKEDTVAPYVDALVQFREAVRAGAKDIQASSKSNDAAAAAGRALLQACDDVRDRVLGSLGVRVEDSGTNSNSGGGGGVLWKMDDPAVLMAELEARETAAKEAAAKKRAAKLNKIQTDLEKGRFLWETPPTQYFATVQADKWKAFDESTGLPTLTAEGEPLSKSQSKTVTKELDKHRKARDKFVKAAEASSSSVEAYLASLLSQMEALEREKAEAETTAKD